MLKIDLTGKRALVAGVADDGGYGFAIAKALAEAGATVCLGTWPPALNIFRSFLERGKLDESLRMSNGDKLAFERIYPLDAAYDELAHAPEDVRTSKRYRDIGDFSIDGLRARLLEDFGDKPLDVVVHSLANGPEVKKPLLQTTRSGYLTAVGVSAYSMVSLVSRLGPLMRKGGAFLSLTYLASERVIPGYGGGMSSAKAALESDTRTLAFEAGQRFGLRVNTVSAGPLASRAATAIGIIDEIIQYCSLNSPLPDALTADEIGATAAFLLCPLASGITGTQFINTSVTAGTSYSYFIRARNSAGTRDSNTASATAPSNCATPNPFLTNFAYTPNPPHAAQDITFQFWGGNFVSGLTQVWFFGPGCSSGCQHPAAGVFVFSSAYMEARNVRLGAGTYSCYLKNGSSGSFVLAGTFAVSP